MHGPIYIKKEKYIKCLLLFAKFNGCNNLMEVQSLTHKR